MVIESKLELIKWSNFLRVSESEDEMKNAKCLLEITWSQCDSEILSGRRRQLNFIPISQGMTLFIPDQLML